MSLILLVLTFAAPPVFGQTGEDGPFIDAGLLRAADGAPADGAVSIHGNLAVVGRSEVAQVFARSRRGDAWSDVARLTVTDGTTGFGTSVAISDDTVVVGATDAVYVSRDGKPLAAGGAVDSQRKQPGVGVRGECCRQWREGRHRCSPRS